MNINYQMEMWLVIDHNSGYLFSFLQGTAFVSHLVPYAYLGPGGTLMVFLQAHFPNFAISV